MKTELLKIKDKTALAFSTPLVSSESRGDFLLVNCDKGFAMCAVLDDRKIENTDIVAIVLPSYDMSGILEIPVAYASPKAKALGIKIGMKGEDALYLLMN